MILSKIFFKKIKKKGGKEMIRSIKELKKGRKHVFEEINREKIRLMNAINKRKYRDDKEKRKIFNRIDDIQAELRLLSWKKKKKKLKAKKKERKKINEKLYKKKNKNKLFCVE